MEPTGEKPRLQLIRETVKHKGIQVPKCEFGDIKNMIMREDDVWVCTFPRSGKLNILCMYIITLV